MDVGGWGGNERGWDVCVCVCLSLFWMRVAVSVSAPTELAAPVGRAGGEHHDGRDGGEVDDAALLLS